MYFDVRDFEGGYYSVGQSGELVSVTTVNHIRLQNPIYLKANSIIWCDGSNTAQMSVVYSEDKATFSSCVSNQAKKYYTEKDGYYYINLRCYPIVNFNTNPEKRVEVLASFSIIRNDVDKNYFNDAYDISVRNQRRISAIDGIVRFSRNDFEVGTYSVSNNVLSKSFIKEHIRLKYDRAMLLKKGDKICLDSWSNGECFIVERCDENGLWYEDIWRTNIPYTCPSDGTYLIKCRYYPLVDFSRNDWNSLVINIKVTLKDSLINDFKNDKEINNIITSKNIIGLDARVIYPVWIKAGSEVTISTYDGRIMTQSADGHEQHLQLFDKNGNYIEQWSFTSAHGNKRTITIANDTYGIAWRWALNFPLQVEFGSKVTEYSEYIPNITYIERESNNPQDIINCNKDLLGKIIQLKRRRNSTNGYYTSNPEYLSNPPILSLLHFSDIHGSGILLDRIKKFKNTYSEYIDDSICTGDMVSINYTETTSVDNGMRFWECCDGDILTCIGNHDAWNGQTNPPMELGFFQHKNNNIICIFLLI